MIVKMTKIRIVGSKTLLMPALELLQEMGAVHIESKPPEVRRAEQFALVRRLTVEEATQQTQEALEHLLNQVKKILLLLPPLPEGGDEGLLPSEASPEALQQLAELLKPVSTRVEALVSKRKIHEDELTLLGRYEKVLKVLSPLISKVRESRDLEYMGLVIQTRERSVLQGMEDALARLTGKRYEIFYEEVDQDTLAGLLVVPREEMSRVKAVLWEENISRLRLPVSITDKPLNEALRIILRKQLELPQKIKKLDRELAEISRRWYGRLDRIRRRLDNKIDQIRVSASFYETQMTFIIYGWIPKPVLPGLRRRLGEQFGERVILEEFRIEEQDQIPVMLINPPWIRPFEIFTRVLPLPRYGTIDPTPFIAAFFPLFFGMIIGDIGYGLILLFAALWAKKRYASEPMVRDLAVIFSWASVSSILWGVAYGELFGDLGERFGLHPLFINRMEDFLTNLYLAVAVGAVHILLGIILGILTALRRGHRREIIAKLTGLVQVVSFLAIGAGFLGWLPMSVIPVGLAVVLASLPVLVIGGGPAAAMELHNLVNILSYLRIMGIGVASVALAFAANKLGSLVGNVLLGILIGIILHTLNLVFGIFSPTIQSLRLHYVEFFENFFQGGGRKYQPFKRMT